MPVQPRALLLAFALLGLVVGAADAQDPVAGATQGVATFGVVGAVLAWHLWRSRERDQEHRADMANAWAALQVQSRTVEANLTSLGEKQDMTNQHLVRIMTLLEVQKPPR